MISTSSTPRLDSSGKSRSAAAVIGRTGALRLAKKRKSRRGVDVPLPTFQNGFASTTASGPMRSSGDNQTPWTFSPSSSILGFFFPFAFAFWEDADFGYFAVVVSNDL